jgi:hypothetical protein
MRRVLYLLWGLSPRARQAPRVIAERVRPLKR